VVVGLVALWGRVIETKNGYRAEFGRPRALLARNSSKREPIIVRAAQLYALEILPRGEVAAWVEVASHGSIKDRGIA
jgi:hypothetical protein